MGEHERGAKKESPKYFKPGVIEELEKHRPKKDIERAMEEETPEKFLELVKQKKLHTYDAELEARKIERGDEHYRHSFEYALMWLYENRPYYAYMFTDIQRRETMEIDTLCVTIRRGRIEMWYNPDFMAIHNLKENVGFLQHEMGHVAQGHLPMQKKTKPEIVNDPVFPVAIDLAVDTLIQSAGDQPPWVLMPSMLRIPKEGVPEDKWETFKERQTWKYYFDLLKKMRENEPEQFQKQVVQIVIGRPQSGMPQGGGGGDGDQEGESKGEGEGKSGDGEKREGEGKGKGQGDGDEEGEGESGGPGDLDGDRSPWTMDDHRGWDSEDSDSAEIQEEVIKQAVSSAFTRANNHPSKGMRGYMAGELIDQIQELLKEKSVPFERIFRAFVGSKMKVGKRPTMVKVSRRRKVPPGRTFERQLTILWAQDDSGSVPAEARALCRSELWHANKSTNVTIYFQRFTHGLAGPMLNLDEVDFKEARKEYCGGTDFNDVCTLAEKLNVDLLLIATDGEAPTPHKKPRVPMGWILTHDGTEHPWGMIIRLPTVAQIKQGMKANIERWLA